MNVLVIGGTRFLGRELVWRLVAAGHRITLFNRGQTADPFGERVQRLRGDRTTEAFSKLLQGTRFDAVVDFAAYTALDVQRAVEVLEGRIGHYVFISSGQTYLVREGCPRPSQEADYSGLLMPEPADPRERAEWAYGIGKRQAEDALEAAWIARRFPATRLRLPMVNGERDYFRRIDAYLWRLLDGGPLVLPDGGDTPTRHVYSGSVARALAHWLGDARTFGQAYNLAQEETPSLREIVAILAESIGAPLRIAPVPRAALVEAGLDPLQLSPFSGRWMSFLDPGRAQRELGFEHVPLRTYLERISSAFLAHMPEAAPPGYEHRAREQEIAGA